MKAAPLFQMAAAASASLLSIPFAVAQTIEIKQNPPAIVLKDTKGRELPPIPIAKGDHVFASVSSLDKGFAFIPVVKHSGPPVLNVIDFASGSASSHVLAGHPFRLIRAGPNQELWILGDFMQSISETGELGDPFALKFEGGGTAAGQVVSAGDRLAISLTNGPKMLYRVGLIDLSRRKVEGVVETRSASQSAKLGAGHFGKDLLKGTELTLATAGLEEVSVHTTYYDYSIAARPDGKFIYSIDFGTHEVTVIDAVSTAKIKTIPVDKLISRFQGSPDGKKLILMGRLTQTIDLASNEIDK